MGSCASLSVGGSQGFLGKDRIFSLWGVHVRQVVGRAAVLVDGAGHDCPAHLRQQQAPSDATVGPG